MNRKELHGRRIVPPVAFGLAIALLCCGFTSAQEQENGKAALLKASKAFTEVAKKAVPAVVFVYVEKEMSGGMQQSPFDMPFPFFDRSPQQRQPFKAQGSGSGFIISPDGYIVTNNHIVGDVTKISVKTSDGKEYEAKLVGADPKSDVALIKVEAEGLPCLAFGDSDALEVGEWVIAVGNPFGETLSGTLTVGVVSAKERSTVGITDYESFIQTDAAINPGNSGGPLLNIDGEVIGINSAIASRTGGYQGIGFAIPINMAKAIVDQLRQSGKVVRGYLGVMLQPVTQDLAQAFGLKDTNGALISDVVEDAPAAKSGLKTGDLVVKLNGEAVRDLQQLRNKVALTAPGTEITLGIIRDGKEMEIKAKLGNLEDSGMGELSDGGVIEKLGFAVQDLTPELAQQLGYQAGSGVVVTHVEQGSMAQRAGIQQGSVIVEVNKRRVKSVSDFTKALAETQNDRVILLVRRGRGAVYVILRYQK
ncbi:MAG TPA: DegQ family serine endoprotease [Candidatus Brocadiia bacterium]|nr:DegQ family serine endoprotease [Candidatus Brocadiia bacterium]